MMEDNKNDQITLPKRRIGFSSPDVVHQDEPKYPKRSLHELINAIIATDERYNNFFYIQEFHLNAVTNSYRLSMELKIQFFINLIQWDIAYPRTPE